MKKNSTDKRISSVTVLDSTLSIGILVLSLGLLRYAPAYSQVPFLTGLLFLAWTVFEGMQALLKKNDKPQFLRHLISAVLL